MHSQLQVLDENIRNCKKCTLSRLMDGGCYPAPGEGPETANILLLGEALGEEEMLEGKPFQGRSGKLLNSILKNAGVNREDIRITNTVHCRPWEYGNKEKHSSKTFKKNRTPTQLEINSCRNWLKEEIDIIKPSLVFTLGKIALKTLWELGSNDTLKFNSQFQLKPYLYKKISSIPLWPDMTVIPLYHPSFLLQYSSKREIELTENVIKAAVDILAHQRLSKENI